MRERERTADFIGHISDYKREENNRIIDPTRHQKSIYALRFNIDKHHTSAYLKEDVGRGVGSGEKKVTHILLNRSTNEVLDSIIHTSAGSGPCFSPAHAKRGQREERG